MDLAKIRKKSLQSIVDSGEEGFTNSTPLPVLNSRILEFDTGTSSLSDNKSVKNDRNTLSVATIAKEEPFIVCIPTEQSELTCSPLEAILAGRRAAGCDDESTHIDDITSDIIADTVLEFLCFRVSDEIYGINIMDIKEIIKPREVTEVPRSPGFVSGVLSLRGTIIAVIDMRLRLGLSRDEPTGKERIIVIKNNNSFSGLLVDEVIQVVRVESGVIEPAPTVLDGIDREFISGIGRSGGLIIIVLNLQNIADIDLY